jgi:long-chain acyl-CoA synthetase
MSQTRPWLAQYDPGVPATLEPYPWKSLLDILADSARQRAAHPALLFQGGRMSYGRLQQLSDEFASALVALGVQPGDRVALLLPNSPQFIIAQMAAWKAGAIVSPLNPRYTEPELVHALNETGARFAIVLSPFYEKFKALQAQTSVVQVIAASIKHDLPPVKRLLFSLLKEKAGGHRIALQHGDLAMQQLLRDHRGHSRPAVEVRPQDPALLMFTGGTTGRPKAAVSSHQALAMAGLQLNSWLGEMQSPWEDVSLMLMPMFHTFGNVACFSFSVAGRYTMSLVPDPTILDDVVQTIHRTRPAYLSGVPTLFVALMNHPDVIAGRVDMKSFRVCISGAAALLAETKRRYEALTGARLVEGYALTESVMAAVITPLQGVYKEGAIGVPLPDVDLRIVDLTGRDLPPGEVGEILISAPQLMLGYWNRPEATANTIRDGWLYTGDLGFLDRDGYLTLVDRAKDVIKPSGFQVWPREVEEVIASHPAVREVGVAGVPDPHRGEAVKAWVVLQPGQTVTAAELRSHCRQQLSSYKVPRQVAFVDNLPKSAVGKVLRRHLAALDAPQAEETEQAPEQPLSHVDIK